MSERPDYDCPHCLKVRSEAEHKADCADNRAAYEAAYEALALVARPGFLPDHTEAR